jgi:hypothetical protein
MNSLVKIPSAQEIAERIRNIGTDLLGIAHDLVAALDAHPERFTELVEAGVNRELISRLEKLGRNQIHPALVFNTSTGGQRLLALPLSLQTDALAKGVEVLEADGTTRHISVNELTPAQARQVFNRGSLRTLAEQRTFLNTVAAKAKPTDSDITYRVYSDHVVVLKPGKFTKALIIQWLAEMA